VPLSQIRFALTALPAGRAPWQEDWRRLSSQWRGEVEERIRRFTQLRDRLDDCIDCGCLSLKVCPLRNPLDWLAHEGPRLWSEGRHVKTPATILNGSLRGLCGECEA
jgi:MerR family redox-sensitive transcriptional activator SoxR